MSGRITYLSLGAGVQSSALLIMAALGLSDCPRADFAIFADTQDEPDWVYAQVDWLSRWSAARGLPVVRVTAGRLADETFTSGGRRRRAALPVFTHGQDGREAMLPRQCTYEYKLSPIEHYVRGKLGYRRRQRIPKGSAEALIGISFDELQRMKPARKKWIVNRWPLIDAGITRSGCVTLLEAHGIPVPAKSSCVYCPYHSDEYWRLLRDREPHNFERACQFDEAVRDSSHAGLKNPVYLHRSLTPLRQVNLEAPAQGRFDYGFMNECEGSCGV